MAGAKAAALRKRQGIISQNAPEAEQSGLDALKEGRSAREPGKILRVAKAAAAGGFVGAAAEAGSILQERSTARRGKIKLGAP